MQVPTWLTFLVASFVSSFGLYRIWLALRPVPLSPQSLRRKGLYALPRRTHGLVGVVYLILGGFLIAGALGYPINPFASPSEAPEAPAGVPVDTSVESAPNG